MSSSIKIVLRKKSNKKGEFPLAIRITKNRKTTFVYTGYYLEEKNWDVRNKKVKKSHPNSTRLNNLLIKKLAEASETVLELQAKNKDFSTKHIKRSIVKPQGSETFNSLGKRFLDELQVNGKLSRLNSDKPRVNHVINFAKTETLFFNEINEDFLRRFIIHLRVKRKNSERSIANNLIVIRTLFNRAIKEGVIDQKFYPFGKDKIKIKFPETQKIGLNITEIQKIENASDLSLQENHARNVWLFSFYSAGMRVGDVLKVKWSDIIDDRLYYQMNKNSKRLSIPLKEKTKIILKKYENNKEGQEDFIFPELKKAILESPKDVLTKTKTATKKFNKYLSHIASHLKIDKKITMHISRHSFGNLSGDKISVEILQKLYRHSNIATTMNYQKNFMHKAEDEALEKVINF
ncbi:site-specific integrase [Polaribacter sp. Hel1_85]|uniref:site-specific integrase n=1 Tax=Polaribacter sp. Hel1_85 TaxID=1250005 RepID=UPI00052B5DF0|nr:site-specific integrase [Polaribacter sp. Hel1_85]KGL62338.1 site-specific recombinase XerD [Polaribacter sp. Hel1_85]